MEEAGKPQTGRRLMRRGEETRRKILAATLVQIAKKGLHGLSHRGVATEAGVPVSLITYFFSGMEFLVEQSFDYFIEVAAPDNQAIMGDLRDFLAGFETEQLRHDTVLRRKVLAHVTHLIAAFIRLQAANHSVGLAVELNFHNLYHLDPQLRDRVAAYRQTRVQEIALLADKIGSDQPEIDASLILTLVHRLQFECLNREPPWPETMLEAEIGRMLELVFRLPEDIKAARPLSAVA